MNRTEQPIGITMGDAAGIGPEIIARLIVEGLPHPAVVYGDAGALRRALSVIGADPHWRVQEMTQAICPPAGVIAVLNRWQALPADLPYGQVSAQAGRGAYVCYNAECLKRALKQKQLDRALDAHLDEEAIQQLTETMQRLLSEKPGEVPT